MNKYKIVWCPKNATREYSNDINNWKTNDEGLTLNEASRRMLWNIKTSPNFGNGSTMMFQIIKYA